jgi:hypothetical protein
MSNEVGSLLLFDLLVGGLLVPRYVVHIVYSVCDELV